VVAVAPDGRAFAYTAIDGLHLRSLADLSVLSLYFGAFSLGSFAYRLYTYGHQLDPHAPMKIAPFMPVVMGSQQIANFVQTSLPLAGTICMTAFLVLLIAALVSSIRQARREVL
jgi:copper chaperone NosL